MTRIATYLLSVYFVLSVTGGLSPAQASTESVNPDTQKFINVEANDRDARSKLASLGLSIEAVRTGDVWGFASASVMKRLEASGAKILSVHDANVARGGHQTGFDFPAADARFHNYAEVTSSLRAIVNRHADISKLSSIGKSVEGRDIWAIQINTTPEALMDGVSQKPGIVFTGTHHAREHLSTEVPLMLAAHILDNRSDAAMAALIDSRDIWIIPMVNPDGVEWDISTGSYKMWRKNRRNNGNRTFGVDLNRNYGFKWGTGGSSTDSSSDVFMGPQPFSEPETAAIRDFVSAHANFKILLSYHTFSELILYPWGHRNEPIDNQRDHQTYETMARTMAAWNGYTPEQSSGLYIASGDTTDWAYGEKGIFSFTFELTPKNQWGGGGFYPGAGVIDSTFQANVKPALYLIDLADDPYRALKKTVNPWLSSLVEEPVRYADLF